MDDVGRTWLGITVCLAVIFLMGFLTACENSLIELRDSETEKLFSKGRRGMVLKKLLREPNRLVGSGLILRAVMFTFLSCAAGVSFYTPLLHLIGTKLWMKLLALAIIIFAVSVLGGAFGVLLPKRLCTSGKIGSGFALSSCLIYRFFLLLVKPVELAASGLSWIPLRAAGVRRSDLADTVTEEEILMMVDAVNETGGIEEAQAEMISNIFEFDDLEVHEIMTHRTDVTALPIDSTIEQAARLVIDEGFSRIPVYEGSIDSICGVIFAKDLLRSAIEVGSTEPIKDLVREIKYVPENCLCDDLFQEFTSRKTQIAVVVDEYGGTAGIVTMEDLLEAIVGSIQDEYDNEIPDIQEITPNTFDITGKAALDEVMEELGCQMPEDQDNDTIGGFVTELLGHIPEEEETASARWQNVTFSVIRVSGRSIEKLRAVIDNPDENESKEDQ